MEEEMIDRIVGVVCRGRASSRAEIAALVGLTAMKAGRLIGLAVQAKRLKLAGRDRFNSPVYELAGQPSGIMTEVVC